MFCLGHVDLVSKIKKKKTMRDLDLTHRMLPECCDLSRGEPPKGKLMDYKAQKPGLNSQAHDNPTFKF